jgi:hypothetical protein
MTVPDWTRDAPKVLRCTWPVPGIRDSVRMCAAPATWRRKGKSGRALCDWHMAHESAEYHDRHPDVRV